MLNNINHSLLDLRELEIYPERQKEIINRRFAETYEYYRFGFFKRLFFMIKFSTMKQAKTYGIMLASFFFLIELISFSHNYYVKSELKISRMTKELEITKNVLSDIDRFYPGVGSGASEIIETLLDDNYKMDKDKILDPFIEEKTKICLEIHGLNKYNIRFKDFIFPVVDVNNSYIRCPENEFGWRKLNWNKDNDFHPALDIYTISSTDIISIGDGRVVYIGKSGKFGNYIVIRHYTEKGYLDSYYGHLDSWKIKINQIVKQGEIIATMGSTGTECTDRHLHFELRCYVSIGKDKNDKDIWATKYYNFVDKSTWNKEFKETVIIYSGKVI